MWLGEEEAAVAASMWASGEGVDVVLESRCGERMPAHQLALGAHSPYLRALFKHATSAPGPCGDASVLVVSADVTAPTVTAVLHFVYHGRLADGLAHAELAELVVLADEWQMDKLLTRLADAILGQMRMENAIGIWRLGGFYPRLDVTDAARRFILYNLEAMVLLRASSEIFSLEAEEGDDLFSDDYLKVSSEEALWEMLGALGLAEQLAHVVRVGFMESSEAAAPVLASRKQSGRKDVEGRRAQDVVLAIGGWSQGAPTDSLEAYDTSTDSWRALGHPCSTPRAYHGVAVLSDHMYLVGGFDGSDYYNSVQKMSLRSGEWSACACMFVPRCYVSVVVLGSAIYALGGFDGRARLATAERLDPERNQWSLLSPMQTPRSDATAVVWKGKLYVIGGFDGHSVLDTVECYDADCNSWTLVGRMGSPRSGVSAVAGNGGIWVFGGFDGEQRLTTGQRFDESGWHEVARMGGARSNFALVFLPSAVAPAILAIGGYNGANTVASVERYDIGKDEWSPNADMHLNRSALKAVVVRHQPLFCTIADH